MNKICLGCGAIMQTTNNKEKGYIRPDKYDESSYCERCFKITHYNEKTITHLENINDYVIKEVNKNAKYVYFLIDLLNLNEETTNTFKKINVPKTLIISKIDIIPNSIKEHVITTWLKDTYNIKDKILYQSTKKNINTTSLINNLVDNNINKCYILGFTNAGKSTLINKLSNNANKITTSLIPNTTIDFINIKLEDNLTIVDSPGFTYLNTIYKENEFDLIKKISPKKFLKPTTYQVKEITSLLIEDKIRIKSNVKNSLTFYMSNDINIERVFDNNKKLTNIKPIIINVPANSDLVIKSLGFINIKKPCKLTIYSENELLFEVRKSMF